MEEDEEEDEEWVGVESLTCFVMPFDHMFIFKTDDWPPSCCYQDTIIWKCSEKKRSSVSWIDESEMGEIKAHLFSLRR